MLISDALETFQFNVLFPPALIAGGVAVNELTVGSGITVTVTVPVIDLPLISKAVNVYVVVEPGETVTEPDAGKLVPTPLSISTLAAPLTTQFNVELPPLLIDGGVAVNEEIENGGNTVTVTVAETESPDILVAINVYVVVAPGETVAEPTGRRPLPTP